MKTKCQSTLTTSVAKGGGQKQNNTICRKWSALALGGFLFISLCLLLPFPMQAQTPAPRPERTGSSRIKVNPVVVFVPATFPFGTADLTWAAGTRHPNAEVRLQVNGQDHGVVGKGGQGAMQIQVVKGRVYVYTLIDSGQLLGTAQVVGK